MTLARVRGVGEETFAAEFDVPSAFVAYPGQFVSLSMPVDGESESSFYTVSSSDVEETVEIIFDAGPDSTLGRELANADPGTTVTVAGPTGDTYYDEGESVVVLAGGPGIGERALTDGRDVAIVYEGTPVDEDRLRDLSAEGARIDVVEEQLPETVSRALAAVDGHVLIYGYNEFVERATDAVSAMEADRKNPAYRTTGELQGVTYPDR